MGRFAKRLCFAGALVFWRKKSSDDELPPV